MRRLPALPIVDGLEHLQFRCTGCGNCCRDLRVAVTHRDVARLVTATEERAEALTSWLGPDEVDMAFDPSSFVELNVGRRLLVLSQRDGACRWLTASERCAVYAARPYDCRLYPFSIEPRADDLSLGVSLLSLTSCDPGGPDAGSLAPCFSETPARLVEQDDARWRELDEYQGLVARWNRLARHRRRLGHRARGALEFFEFVGLIA